MNESGGLKDPFDRRIDYLRISITDRCNLKCIYCVPDVSAPHPGRAEMLTTGEIVRFVRIAHERGVSKVRITGGEPLLRPDILELVREIKEIGIKELGLTTNGMMLGEMAGCLKQAGLDRVNISMDTMDENKYRLMTRGGELGSVWKGIEEAERVRLTPIKINVVPIRDINDNEATDFAQLTLERDWHIRFIELMPVGRSRWSNRARVKKEELASKISVALGSLRPHEFRGKGPSRNYRLPGAKGIIGFISPISECFCQWCNRLRITSRGKIRPCLFSGGEIDIMTPMRKGASDEELDKLFRNAIAIKPAGHRLEENDMPVLSSMSAIGG